MLFTGQEYCKILNKNALPCIHGVLVAVCTLTLLIRGDFSELSLSRFSTLKKNEFYSIPVP